MCGRYTLKRKLKELSNIFKAATYPETEWEPRFNIAPSQEVPVILEENGNRTIRYMKWGLVPNWSKDKNPKIKPINARGEEASNKPYFRQPFIRRRCVIPVDSFYEWKEIGPKKKVVFNIYLKNKELISVGGLWDRHVDIETGKTLDSCVIVTTHANELMSRIHDRMPVILPDSSRDTWLSEAIQSREIIQSLITPYDSGQMGLFEVSGLVNSPRIDSPDCEKPLEPKKDLEQNQPVQQSLF